jgi:hypothetical protein
MGDLIKRLRDCANGIGSFKSQQGDYGLCDDAADRIEELVEENKELTLQLLAAHGQAADALDKLTKAMEALRVLSQFNAVTNSHLNVYNIFKMTDRARAALAELEVKE